MRNLKLTIRYDGTDFYGWQTQPGQRTVQETLEKAIAEITREERVRVQRQRPDRRRRPRGRAGRQLLHRDQARRARRC